MGISVSVDSWLEQNLEALAGEACSVDDPIFHNLIRETTTPAEVFILPTRIMANLFKGPKENVVHLINACTESIISSNTERRPIAAAILIRIIPFMIDNGSVDFHDFFLGQQEIYGRKRSPGGFLIEKIVLFIASLQAKDPDEFYSAVEAYIPLLDLLLFLIFTEIHFYHNQTLFHTLISVMSSKFVVALLNYIHVGGENDAVLALMDLILFHPCGDYRELVEKYQQKGGNVIQALATKKSLYALFAVLFAGIPTRIALSVTDPSLIRLQLLIMTKNPPEDMSGVQCPVDTPLFRSVQEKEKHSITEFIGTEAFRTWFTDTIANLYLGTKQCYFDGTGYHFKVADFSFLDNLVLDHSV